jgi:hypothetical protein
VFVFDTCSLIRLNLFNKTVFSSLWINFNALVQDGSVTSTREVLSEVEGRDDEVHSWCRENNALFSTPSANEVMIVGQILSIPKVLGTLPRQNLLSSRPYADPYIIARARALNGTVVTEEKHKPNSSKIPTICADLGVDCVNLDGFMILQGWKF